MQMRFCYDGFLEIPLELICDSLNPSLFIDFIQFDFIEITQMEESEENIFSKFNFAFRQEFANAKQKELLPLFSPYLDHLKTHTKHDARKQGRYCLLCFLIQLQKLISAKLMKLLQKAMMK